MLSERERQIIEAKGQAEFLKETIEELLDKEVLDEFEEALLKDCIDQLRTLEEIIDKLIKGE